MLHVIVCSRPKDDSSEKALLLAARELFYERGFHAVSTRDIAEKANVNLGCIQYHFGSKQNLFIEVVRSLLAETGCKEGRQLLLTSLASSDEAAVGLVSFLYGMLDYMLRPTGPQVCRLMFREVLGTGSQDEQLKTLLVNSVLNDFYVPWIDSIKDTLKVINPLISDEELRFHTYSVIGQCSFYITDRPFIETLEDKDFSDESFFHQVVQHVSTSSLRAIRYPEENFRNIIEKSMMLGKEYIRGSREKNCTN